MAAKSPAPSSAQATPPPSPVAICCTYVVLGAIVSIYFGREPVTLPEDLIKELGPTLTVVIGFIISYNIWDVMAVGAAKGNARWGSIPYNELPNKLPEEAYLAQRVQTNQVEQFPGYIVGSLSCALVVNGKVAAILALMWAILRRVYATTYRNSVGVPVGKIGLAKLTIPCYFLMNTLLMATAVHCVRAMFR